MLTDVRKALIGLVFTSTAGIGLAAWNGEPSQAQAPTPAPMVAGAPNQASAAPPVEFVKPKLRLEMQTAFNPGVSVLGEGARQFTRGVQAISGGQLRLKMLEAGGKVPSGDLLDAVVKGEIEAAYTHGGYAAAKSPALVLFASMPFGPTPEEYVGWMIDGEGGKLHAELYEKLGVHAVFCGVGGPEAGGWFRSEINGVTEFKGMRLRYGGMAAEVLARFGAVVVSGPAGEVFQKLEQGKLDGAEYSMPSIDRGRGFEKLGLFYYFPGWHQPGSVTDFYMRKDRWDALQPEQRVWIETACRANVAWTMARAPGEQARAVAFFRAAGISLRSWSPATLDALRETATEVLNDHADKDPDVRRTRDNMRAYLDATRAWRRLSQP